MTAVFSAAGKLPLLEHDRERQLLAAWQHGGDRAALEELISSHARMVGSWVSKVGGSPQDRDELMAEGFLGLVKAANKFDLSRDVRFSTYARWWVRNHVFAARSRLGTIVDAPKGMPGGEAYGPPPVTSDNDLVDALESLETTPEEELIERSDSAQVRKTIVEAMQCLSSLEQEVVIARHLQSPAATVEELAGRKGMTGDRLRQVERRAMSKLKFELLKRGVTSFRPG